MNKCLLAVQQLTGFRIGLLLLLFMSPAFSQDGNESEPELLAAATEAAEQQALENSRQLQQRLDNIQYLQENLGIYDPALQEAYYDLAQFLIEQQSYEDAASYFNQALQISRINSGLYSEDQFPIIEALISSNRLSGDWVKVDGMQELNLHMHRRMYALHDSRYIAALAGYGAWKLRLLRENLLDQGFYSRRNLADELSEIYAQALAALSVEGSASPAELFNLIAGKSEADVMLARAIAQTPYTAFQGTASRYVTQQRCTRVRNAQGQLVSQCVNVRVENPRYRASQRSAKTFALVRYTRSINDSIEQLMALRDQNPDLPRADIEKIESQIASLEVQNDEIRRINRRESLF